MTREKHPTEFYLLASAAIFSRCTFWGFGNLFVLFLLQSYSFSNEKTTALYGIFTGSSAFFPFIGGYLVDRWNYYQPLFLAPLITIVGFLLLLFHNEYLLYVTMGLLAIGYGLFTSSSIPLLHHVYRHNVSLREKGFLWFYSAFNLGVFASISLFGWISQIFSWNVAWIVGVILSCLGLIPTLIFYKKYHTLYANLHPRKRQVMPMEEISSEKKIQKDRIYFLCILNVCSLFFWAFYIQGWSSLSIFLVDHIKGGLPISSILASSNLFIFLLVPLFLYIDNHRKKPSSLALVTSYALFFLSISFAILLAASFFSDKIYFLYPIIFFFFLSMGELLIGPAGLSATTQLAPKKFTSFFVGIWYFFMGIAFIIGGQIAGF
ncbi:MAG: MFS transporter, partial [Chlamydiota bacterium]